MIYCLTGEVIYLDALNYTAVIDCAGVGYKLTVTANTLTKLSGAEGKEVRVFTHLSVSENAVELYGFFDTDELEAFKLLIAHLSDSEGDAFLGILADGKHQHMVINRVACLDLLCLAVEAPRHCHAGITALERVLDG